MARQGKPITRGQRIGMALLLLAAVVGGIWALYWAIGPRSDTARNEFARTVVQILGGGALLASLYFTYRNLQVNLDTLLQNQQANLTDRFAKAVEQLANDKLEVKLGAIFALERLAKDSERDHATIMELLTTYVRENTRWRAGEEEGQQDGGEVTEHLAMDIQAILTVIGRRSRWYDQGENIRLDLSRTRLARANLVGAHLEAVSFVGADLSGADLSGADLSGAHLSGAHLIRANLTGAHLIRADLSGADLTEAYLIGAAFWEADLTGAVLRGADLRIANLINAHLIRADLTGADLTGTNLSGAHFTEADLTSRHH